jgi:hypothetical protein
MLDGYPNLDCFCVGFTGEIGLAGALGEGILKLGVWPNSTLYMTQDALESFESSSISLCASLMRLP